MKKKMRIIAIVAALAAVLALGLLADEFAKLPGINTEDQHPNGCVDCHKVSGDSDFRLNVSLKEVSGHPPIDSMVNVLPIFGVDCS